jgi:hypothetical protein
MSFHISFFARDVNSAHNKLREAHAPAALKALIELALGGIARSQSAGVPAAAAPPTQAPWPKSSGDMKAMAAAFAPPAPRTPSLCGVRVEASGHIDENGQHSFITAFKVEPLFD